MSCKSKTYCPYPFIGASLQSDGLTLPCGQYMNVAPFKKFNSIDEARNSAHMQDMRMKMLNDQHDSGCQCPAEEAAGIWSMRQSALKQFGYNPFGKLKTVELFFDNICNLKCRMCASSHSHLWFEEEKELYGTTINPTKYVKRNISEELNVSELEEIKIYGGEPLQSLEAEKFFGRLLEEADVSNISIDMSTNATKIPLPNTLEVFKRCKHLKLNLSIDAYGKLNDFIRSGSNWDEIVENMKFFDTLIDMRTSDTLIVVHSAIGIYNANLIHELNDYVKNNFPRFVKLQQMIQYPVFLNLQNAPDEYKKLIEPFIDDDTKRYMYNNIAHNYFEHFLNFHNKLNTIRSEEFIHNKLLSDFMSTHTPTDNSKQFFLDQIKFLVGK
jgi:sulfatase maturation enzyme AslB (radical SAM superfamily)